MLARWNFSICLVGPSHWGCVCKVFELPINGSSGLINEMEPCCHGDNDVGKSGLSLRTTLTSNCGRC